MPESKERFNASLNLKNMTEEIKILLITAASVGFFHTLLGPDHYLPFIVMSKARKWSVGKTIWLTILCGIGHVGSSVVIGSIGIGVGIGVSKLEVFEGVRGSLAAWMFVVFGLSYFLWGLFRARIWHGIFGSLINRLYSGSLNKVERINCLKRTQEGNNGNKCSKTDLFFTYADIEDDSGGHCRGHGNRGGVPH
ncbi:MAG: hypothetical protein JRF65_09045 [Deltaproteobacteria bacterium]|nr:hypothetical protein [Deltaproteobacteria bacterium]MBW2284731.1 hypothetical protein [Deltaproteobacteria bacterium]